MADIVRRDLIGGLRLVQVFALDEELAGWEAQLAQLQGGARLDLLAPLAWHLRQRSPERARGLAEEAAPLAACPSASGACTKRVSC
jgi:hypothetical protein